MTNKKILIINGPNLNLLGKREASIYGTNTLKDLEKKLNFYFKNKNAKLIFYQSNLEGEIINIIQKNLSKQDSIIINAGGYSHTSIAISDCLRLFQGLIYEVHISNIHKRETFRHHSYVSQKATAVIAGFGIDGYTVAIRRMAELCV